MIQRQLVVPADPDRLWRALTDPDEVAEWLGGTLEWTLSEGEPLRFVPDPGTGVPVREGRVDEVDPGRYLRFRWWPVSEADPAGEATEVVYVLEPLVEDDECESGLATVLTVEEAPLTPAACTLAPTSGVALTATAWSPADSLALRLWAERARAGGRLAPVIASVCF